MVCFVEEDNSMENRYRVMNAWRPALATPTRRMGRSSPVLGGPSSTLGVSSTTVGTFIIIGSLAAIAGFVYLIAKEV